MRRTGARCRWLARVAEPLGAALALQMATDELRELLDRYPEIGPADLRRLRQLYRDASATEVMAILSSPELGPKARRLERPSDSTWDRWIAASAAIAALLIALYLLLQRSGVSA